jgi:hypothetical protein
VADIIGTAEDDEYSVRAVARSDSFGFARWPPLMALGARAGWVNFRAT